MKIKLGATEDFPDGKLCDDDEGGLQLAVYSHEGIIMIRFGKPVAWIGLPPDTAVELAEILIQHASTTKASTR